MSVRIMASGVVAAAAIALGSAVFAQNVPSEFVVSGKAAEQIQDFTTINLATAERIAEACEKLAAAEASPSASWSSTTTATMSTWTAWTGKAT